MRDPIYISMTSISSRIHDIEQVIYSLLNQSLVADKLILNISRGSFLKDNGISESDFSPFVREMIDNGRVELHYCVNTGPYRKIIPTLERYSNDAFWVATADDDVIYSRDWLNGLVQESLKYNCISAYRCRLLLVEDGKIFPYNSWPLINSSFIERFGGNGQFSKPSLMFFPTGRDGVLYHSTHLHDLKALSALQALAPFQDDIALKLYTLAKNIPVAIVPLDEKWESEIFPGTGNAGPTLWSLNKDGENDKVIARILDYSKAGL